MSWSGRQPGSPLGGTRKQGREFRLAVVGPSLYSARRMQHRVFHILASMLATAVLLGSSGCSQSSCADLAERVCAATDAKTCERTRASLGGEAPKAAQEKACAVVLEHEQTLNATIDVMKKRSGQ